MKKEQIKLGGTYLAKVTDKVVEVRLDAENAHGGWDATNLATGKKVRIKSAQRLRGPAERSAGEAGNKIAKAVAKAQAKDAAANASATDPDLVPLTQIDKEKKAAAKTKGAKAPKTPKADKGLSCLNAAVEVLKASKEPMQCKAMIDAMSSKKLWTSDAPTPAATLYSAILREIQKKGKDARFKKTERGHFALTA